MYKPKVHYTAHELWITELEDIREDALFAEHQSQNGPYYPDRGITAKSLSQYATKCWNKYANLLLAEPQSNSTS